MKKILVTGCNGQLGKAVNAILSEKRDYELVNVDLPDTDITDNSAIVGFIRELNPYAIINCAAFTNVNGCETEEDTAFKANALGPRNLAIAANETGAKLFQVSTDYVFSGDDGHSYIETDAVSPKSAYGRTKLAGEQFVQAFSDKYFILRTAWMFGDGNNFVKTMLRLSESRDKVTVVNDQFGTPTWSMDLAQCIAELLPTDNYGLFHATGEGETCWADFTKEIFRIKGRSTEVVGVSTAEYEQMAPGQAVRPAYSVLDNRMLRLTGSYTFPAWEDSIRKYLL